MSIDRMKEQEINKNSTNRAMGSASKMETLGASLRDPVPNVEPSRVIA